ncbi:MAG: hypothetical protein DRP70_07905, partial [Spirochaetes bacterium]
EYLVLVDKEHALPEEFIPADILDLDSFDELETGKNGLSLDRKASDALVQLSKAAREDGITLLISSAYRSYGYQQGLFKRYADRDGEEAASRYSARAGTSQHQLGTTVDLGSISDSFAESRAGEWMAENAGGYGWSLSYPRNFEEETGYKWESWHWRWIGVDAVKMQDEFFNGVQQRLLIFWNENASRIREAHAAADQESVGLNHSGLIPRRMPKSDRLSANINSRITRQKYLPWPLPYRSPSQQYRFPQEPHMGMKSPRRNGALKRVCGLQFQAL